MFSKNRDRLLEGDIAAKFLGAILSQPKVKRLLSTDHFSVDGTLIEAWASIKSFKPKDGPRGDYGEPPSDAGGRNKEADFHGERRSNETHASTTDPDAKLYRKGKGKEAKLCLMGHGLMENRHGLLVDAYLTEASGYAERVAALHMIGPFTERTQAITLGADKGLRQRFAVDEGHAPMWRRTSMVAARPLMDARRAIPAIGSACASASASRRRSAGSKPPPGRIRRSSVAATASYGSSPSRPPPMIWCG